MANHVDCYISLKMNETAQKNFEELCTKTKGDAYDFPFSALLLSEEEEWTYDKQCDLVGPKWSHVEDYSGDHLTTVSAWGYPLAGVGSLLKLLSQWDPYVTASVAYADEMPNFFGKTKVILNNDGEPWQVAEIEFDYDDLILYAVSTVEELKDKWDHEKEEWKDEESQDHFSDIMYDLINDMQEILL